MKPIIISIALVFSSLTYSQINRDSLLNIWHDETQADSTRAEAYNNYIWNGFLFNQPDSAFTLAEDLIAYGQREQYPKAEAQAYNLQGISYHVQGYYTQALDYYQSTLRIFEVLSDKNGIANTLNNIGSIYNNQGNYPQALDYYQRSLKMTEELGDKNGIANSLNNIGLIYYNQGNYSQALDYHKRSLKIAEGLGDKNGIASSLNNIGIIYRNQGNYPKALDYFQRSVKIREERGDKNRIANTLNNIGIIYRNQGNYPKALDYSQRSLKIAEGLGDKMVIVSSLNNIGFIYIKQERYGQAIEKCTASLELSQEIGAVDLQKNACQCLYDAYKAKRNGNEALKYMELMRAAEDSLYAKETAKKLQQMEFAKTMLEDSIAKAEEARLIEEAHQEEMRQEEKTRNWLIGGGIFALLLAVGFYGRWRYVRKSKATLQVEKNRSENLLLNILPVEIAQELKEKGKADARDFEMVSILFTDFKGFTEQSAKLSAADLVNEINHCFEAFDGIMEKYDIEKIKTIGDAYMAAGGLPVNSETSVKDTVLAALEMQNFIIKLHKEKESKGEHAFEMRVGIHTGPVVAGIVGVKKFQYDIWGDTVNTASRMESSGEVGKVNISEDTYNYIKDEPEFIFESRGKIKAKGKGEIEMYFVNRSLGEG